MDFGRESFSRILSGESGGISFFCGVPGGNAGSSARAKAAADGMLQANPAVLVAFRNDRRFMRSRFMRSPERRWYSQSEGFKLCAWLEYYGAVLKNATRNRIPKSRSVPANIKSVGWRRCWR